MDEISQIDSRIALLENEIHNLRRRRNTLNSLCQMPTELVVRIFKYAQLHGNAMMNDEIYLGLPGHFDMEAILEGSYFALKDEHAAYAVFGQRPGTRGTSRNWRDLASTCFRLREICISAPELWSSVHVPGNDLWRKLCLERTRNSPLSLKIGCNEWATDRFGIRARIMDSDQVDGAVEEATQLIKRASAAYVDMPHSLPSNLPPGFPAPMHHEASRTEDYINMISQDCSVLRNLSLRFSRQHLHGTSALPLPASLLGGVSSSLTTLQLESAIISVYPKLPNLLHLKLTGCTIAAPDTKYGNAIVSWLIGSPRIQVLHIGDNTIQPRIEVQDNKQLVLMPDLRVLRVHGTWHNTSGLLHPLTLPHPSTVLDMTITDTNQNFNFGHIHPHLNGSLTEGDLRGVFQRATQFWDAQVPRQNCGSDLSAKVIFNVNHVDPQIILKSPSQNITEDPSRPYLRLIAPHLGTSPILHMIKTLHLNGDRVGPTAKGTHDSGNIKCMDLDTVIVAGASTATHINQLGKWLTQRKKDGRAVRTLQIRLPLTEKAKETLDRVVPALEKKEIVEVVEWFGSQDLESRIE